MHDSITQQLIALKHRQPDLYSAAPATSTSTSAGMVTTADFVSGCLQSLLPLGHSEAFMLAQLLVRRRAASSSDLRGVAQGAVDVSGLDAVATAAVAAAGGGSSLAEQQQQLLQLVVVDADLLRRVEAGDFLPAALA